MGLVLSVYTKDSFREYILPPVNNTDYNIMLEKDYFCLRADIMLRIEILDGIWRICAGDNYLLNPEGSFSEEKSVIKDNAWIRAKTSYGEDISIIVREMESAFHCFEKFLLKPELPITIGKREDCSIIYDYMGMVSHRHADIRYENGSYVIRNHSANGIYINNVRIDKKKTLVFGDYINIIGLHFVFLGDLLAVDTAYKPQISETNLPRFKQKVLKGIPSTDTSTVLKEEAEKGKKKSQFPTIKRIYHRSPRNYEKILNEEIEIEGPPPLNRPKRQSLLMAVGPSVTMALPMLLGCMLMVYASRQSGGSSLYMYSGLVMALSSAFVGVIWGIANIRNEQKEYKEEEERRFKLYGDYLVEKADQIKEKYAYDVKKLSEVYPDPVWCIEHNEAEGRLWNRNSTHDDFLSQRLGLGLLPFPVKMNVPKVRFSLEKDNLAEKPAMIREHYEKMENVPITVDLIAHTLIGIVGGTGKQGAWQVARVIACQLALNNCYTDVKMAFLYDGERTAESSQWEFARWLPHVWGEGRKTRYIGSSKREASDVLYELTNVLRIRQEQTSGYGKKEFPKPWYVVFVSDLSLLEGELFSKYALADDQSLGLTTILLCENYEDLPNGCEYIIENTENFHGMYHVTDDQRFRQAISFDNVSPDAIESFARQISGLRVSEIEESGEIPESLTFFDMLHIKHPYDLPVRELWAKNRIYENIRGQIGEKAGGVPCYLDVHEKYHGPHGLVAGTTGSGKSETLQTYMLSLAIEYSPDDIGFFIIDYKGGGMANLFEGLPHMVGQISNLSGSMVHRAMVSIKSENRRRQRLFNESGVNKINDYTKLYKAGEVQIPIPHLFIIIDEFAELKREEPDFMRELISVAQVGRSLGVHLVLATQKPSGTVDDNIWSNSKFRLCLRVQDQQDSKDMLHKPDAAFIQQAGRCYLQVGNDEVYELFQSGYSGAAYHADADSEETDTVILIDTTGKVILSSSILKKAKLKQEKKTTIAEITQLDAVKDYLAEKAVEYGYTYKQQLWMPPLSEMICLDDIENEFGSELMQKDFGPERQTGLPVTVGIFDDPANQRRSPLTIDLMDIGNLGIIGSIVSGKSTLLQTIAYALITRYSPDQVHMYILDFSSKMMSAFETAPQVGGIMYENDLEKISKFFNMISRILEMRKTLLRGGNFRQYVISKGEKLPAILIFIDNYGAFKEKTSEKYEEQMITLSKEGVSHGIFLIIAGGGFGMSDITSRVGENLNKTLCLSLGDRYAYTDYLHTLAIDVLPESGIKGRGLSDYDGRILEFQAALALKAENDYKRMEYIGEVCSGIRDKWHGDMPMSIPEIPEKPVWSEFSNLLDFKARIKDINMVPVGYDMANAEVYSVDLRQFYCYTICGMQRTGKTNFMKVFIQSALLKGSNVYIIDDPDKTLKAYESDERVTYASDENAVFELFKEITPIFQERNRLKHQLIAQDMEEEEIYDRMSQETPCFIFISKFDWFVPFIYSAGKNMSGFLETIIEKGKLHNFYFISDLALNKRSDLMGYRIFDLFVSYHIGIHFGGKVLENQILSFDYVPFKDQNRSDKPGIGQLPDIIDEKATSRIVVPLARR